MNMEQYIPHSGADTLRCMKLSFAVVLLENKLGVIVCLCCA